jgi:hypothetical protein
MSNLGTSVVGYEAPRFIAKLVQRIPVIEAITLFSPPSSLPIQQDSSMNSHEQELIEHALKIRSDLGLPFWDSLLLYLSTHPVLAQGLLKRATLHNPQDLEAFRLHRDDCIESQLRKLIENLPHGRVLAMSSRMQTKEGKLLHLPMLDFHCVASPGNESLVKSVMAEIGLSGHLAMSGRSYHFYGSKLIDEQSLLSFLGKSLLFSPIVDRAWVAHQVIERACGLRISPGKDYKSCPVIVAEI